MTGIQDKDRQTAAQGGDSVGVRVVGGPVSGLRSPVRGRKLETLLAGIVLFGIALTAWRFVGGGYLPQPFYYKPAQSLMDGYSTAFWANHGGAYDSWRTLYPPLSFVLLKAVSSHRCYQIDAMEGRACDPGPATMLVVFFLLNAGLVYLTYRRRNRSSALPRAVAMGLGLPMLYALERGNLLIVCFTAFVLGYGELLRKPWLRAVSLAISINFKPYLLFSVIPFILRRKWGWLFACALAGLVIYFATYLVFRAGTPLQIWTNDVRYGAAASTDHFADLYYATSFWPLIRSLHAGILGSASIPPEIAGGWALALTIVLRVTQVGACGLLIAGLFRPKAVDIRRFAAMAACVSLTAFTTGSSGYALIFLLFLAFFEPWRGRVRPVIIVLAYLLCIPVDHILLPVVHGPAVSYLSGRTVVANFGISVGQLARPAALLVMLTGLISLNAVDVFGHVGRKAGLGFGVQPLGSLSGQEPHSE
jgi:hypothetical protein